MLVRIGRIKKLANLTQYRGNDIMALTNKQNYTGIGIYKQMIDYVGIM